MLVHNNAALLTELVVISALMKILLSVGGVFDVRLEVTIINSSRMWVGGSVSTQTNHYPLDSCCKGSPWLFNGAMQYQSCAAWTTHVIVNINY